MPLPPLPDEATVNSAGHITDSTKQENYLRALAQQYKIDIGVLPDPNPDHDGHVVWHNAMTVATKKVADAIGAKVVLPPLTVKTGDLSHVTHHNLVTKALADMSAAVPFKVEGGTVTDVDGWRIHSFAESKTAGLTVSGSGKVTAIVVAVGGGQGFYNPDNNQKYNAGKGGGGSVAEVSKSARNAPVINLTTGSYNVVVGTGGASSVSAGLPGVNGGLSSFVGADVSLTATGGGGGGSADAPGQSAGTGGGGGGFFNYDGSQTYRVTPGGTGNPGGKGSPGKYSVDVKGGAGGGACGDAVIEAGYRDDIGGYGFEPDPQFMTAAIDVGFPEPNPTTYRGWGAGGMAQTYEKIPGRGGGAGFSADAPGYPGIVQIGYKIAQLLERDN